MKWQIANPYKLNINVSGFQNEISVKLVHKTQIVAELNKRMYAGHYKTAIILQSKLFTNKKQTTITTL